MTKFYKDNNGKYLGAFDVPPANATEIANPPSNAKHTWDDVAGNWVDPKDYNAVVSKEKLKIYLQDIGKWEFFKVVRDSRPEYVDNWEAEDTIDTHDHLLRAVARGLGTTAYDMIETAQDYSNTVAELPVDLALEEHKSLLKALVNAEREHRKFTPVVYDGNTYNVSEWDILMIMSLLQTSNSGKALPTDEYWRTADNINVNLNNTDLNNLDELIRVQMQTAYVWSWTKKAEIDACATIAECDLVDLELTSLA